MRVEKQRYTQRKRVSECVCELFLCMREREREEAERRQKPYGFEWNEK